MNVYRLFAHSRIAAIVLITSAALSFPAQAGTYTANWLGGTGIWEQDGANWSTIAYPNNGHFTIVAGNPYPDNNPLYNVVINNPLPCTLGLQTTTTVQSVNVANGSTLNLLSGTTLNPLGALTNNGLITLNATSSQSHLRVGNGSGVGATGVISMSDNVQNYISGSGTHGDTFTIAAGGVITGAGTLNIGFFGGTQFLLNYVNQGLIEATQPVNALRFNLENGVNSNLTNTGILRASGSGTMHFFAFSNANVFNTGGTIEATGNGKVRVGNGVTVTGGTLSTSGNGTIHGDYPGNGGGTLSNVTSTGRVALADGEQLGLKGTFTNNGLVTLDSTGSGTSLSIRGNTTVGGSGSITLGNNFNNEIAGGGANGYTLAIGSGATVTGGGHISTNNANFGSNFLNVVNQGLIESTTGMTIYVYDAASSTVTNSGTLRASTGSTLSLAPVAGAGTVTNTGGVIEALNNSTVRIGSNIAVEGGTLATSGTGTIRGAGLFAGGGTLSNVTNTGRVALADGEQLGLKGTFTNNGLVTLDSTGSGTSLSIRGNTTVGGSGSITLGNNFNNEIAGGGANGYTLTIGSGATVTGGGHISTNNANFGSNFLNVVNQGLIESTTGMTIYVYDAASSTVTNSGTLRANGANLAFQGVGGSNTVTNNGGIVEALAGSSITGSGNVRLVQNSGTTDLRGGNMSFSSGATLNGGVLKGTGTFTGPIGVNANAILQGGNGAVGTTLSVAGTVSLNDNSIIELTLGPSATHSTLARTGGGTWVFDSNQAFMFLDAGATQGTFYNNIITGLNANPGTTAMWTITNPGWTGVFSYDGANIDLNVTSIAAVPEPSTWVLGLLALGALFCLRVRRRYGPW